MKIKEITGKNMRSLLEIHEELMAVSSQCRVSFFNKLNNGVADSLGNLFEMIMTSLDNTEVIRYSKFILKFTDENVDRIFNPTTTEESILASFSATIGVCFFILDNIELVVEKGATCRQIDDIYIILFHALINAPNNDFYDKNLVDFKNLI